MSYKGDHYKGQLIIGLIIAVIILIIYGVKKLIVYFS